MNKLIVTLLIALTCFGCAKSEREVRCKIIYKFNSHGEMVHGYWDVERYYEVPVEQCTEIIAIGDEYKT